MTTVKRDPTAERITFPDPDRSADDMTTFEHLAASGGAYLLIQHFGRRETTLVTGEHFLSPEFRRNVKGLRIPDLLVAFDVDPVAFKQTNAYVIAEQGKPPDFVMEVASRSTGRRDIGEKRDYYERIGVPEFWRFDETGRFHGARLGGDRLVNGRYVPVTLEELPNGDLQGFCEILNLFIRWESGQLGWYDPDTGQHIATFEDERSARILAESRVATAESRVATAESRVATAESRVATAESRAATAESRVQALEAELRRLRGLDD